MLTQEQEVLKRLWIDYVWTSYTESGQEVVRHLYSSIGSLLGYPVAVDTTLSTAKIQPYAVNGTNQGNSEYFSLVYDIVEIQVMLQQALKDSMASEIGDLKLDMGTYINNLKAQGSSKLAILSRFTGIPIAVDLFTGRTYTTSTTPYSIRSLL